MSLYNALKTGESSVLAPKPNATGKGMNSLTGDKGTDSLARRRQMQAAYRTNQENEANRQRVSYLDNAYTGQNKAMLQGREDYRNFSNQAQGFFTDARDRALGNYQSGVEGTQLARTNALANMQPYVDQGSAQDAFMQGNMLGPDAWRSHQTGATASSYLPELAEKQAMAAMNATGGGLEGVIAAKTAYGRKAIENEEIARARFNDDYMKRAQISDRGFVAAGAQNDTTLGTQNMLNQMYSGQAGVNQQAGAALGNWANQRAGDEYNMENALGASYANYMNARGNQGEKYATRFSDVQNAIFDWQMNAGYKDYDFTRQADLQKEIADKQMWGQILSAGLGAAGKAWGAA